ncbi:MAG: hypothetical protein A3E78_12950 [Alphaproteobacteria bacterium RIFCSPHIGHO2_12_FULL_63_12]|nr:MAG: hypothetical protein A3E78_12950 [Alphaproteobacteria bacterium RIFCSPHIGHO2_12_FULL_63_12]
MTIIDSVNLDVSEIDALVKEARAEGYSHIDRLVENWRNCSNRFDLPGEILLAARFRGRIVAVGGLNCDPYLENPRIGRVRHLYVMPNHRRTGVGHRLVGALLERARGHFAVVRVRAAKGDAPLFYDAIGFQRVGDRDASHKIQI